MNILIIFSHPERKSLNGAFLDAVLSGINQNKSVMDFEVLDLYADDFDALLKFDKNKRRRDMHSDPAFEKYRKQLTAADELIFIYPIWWGRPPAILMGWIDQIFSSDLLTGVYRGG